MKNYSSKWLAHFARHAHAARDKSKDTTKVGAVLIGDNNEVLLTGFNDHSIGIKDYIDRRSRENGKKYRFAAHAERNIISFAARHGIRTQGMTIYSTHFPCCDCANAIVQAGITCVITGELQFVSGTDDVIKDSRSILIEGGVQIIKDEFNNRQTVERAEALVRAFLYHKLDLSGVPLFYHCKDVMEQVGDDAPLNFKLAALLHDIIEDSKGAITKQVILDMGFPEEVAESVDLLSIKDDDTYEIYIDRLIESKNMLALVVKIVDNYCNLRPERLAMLPLEKQEYFKNRYIPIRAKLIAAFEKTSMNYIFIQNDYFPHYKPAFKPIV